MSTPTGLPTASKLQLALTCPASQVMPVIDSAWAAGDAGREKHQALQDYLTAPPSAGFELPPWLDSVSEHLEALRSPDIVPELALAYDVATRSARVLGQNLGRSYPETKPTEFYGSFDYVLLADGSVTVVDLKTGMSDVPHPARNAQLRFGALAAARYHRVESARVGILHAPEGRTPWWTWANLDAFDLEEIAGEMKSLADRIGYARNDYQRGKTPRLRVGEHCGFCPARFACPARVAMAQRLAGEPEKVVLDLKAMLTPESAAMALGRWQAATKALAEVGAALHAYASESPIPLGDGRVWGPRASEREVIDAGKAWPVLAEKFGAEVARKAMSLDTSKAGVNRAMQALRESLRGAEVRPPGVPPGKVTIRALNEEALKALREAGCIARKTSKTFEAYAVAGQLDAGRLDEAGEESEAAAMEQLSA
jgi:hypothetical protein